MLAQRLFNVFKNDQEINVTPLLIKFVSDANMTRMVKNDEYRAVTECDLVSLLCSAHSHKMHFNTAKCKGIQLKTMHTGHTYRMKDCPLEGSGSKKYLEVIMDKQSSMRVSQHDVVTKRASTRAV